MDSLRKGGTLCNLKRKKVNLMMDLYPCTEIHFFVGKNVFLLSFVCFLSQHTPPTTTGMRITLVEIEKRNKVIECLKQDSAHPHEVDHQLGSARHRVFRSFKPRTLSGRRISSNQMITTPHWIASSSPDTLSL